MKLLANAGIGVVIAMALFAAAAQADPSCQNPVLLHQRRDVATIESLELEWSRAFLRGDPALEECLLTADFTEIMRNGDIKSLADELALAAKNTAHPLPLGSPVKPKVLLHGNVAVAYGRSPNSAVLAIYADYYVWEDGRWRVYFAQQTGAAPSR